MTRPQRRARALDRWVESTMSDVMREFSRRLKRLSPYERRVYFKTVYANLAAERRPSVSAAASDGTSETK